MSADDPSFAVGQKALKPKFLRLLLRPGLSPAAVSQHGGPGFTLQTSLTADDLRWFLETEAGGKDCLPGPRWPRNETSSDGHWAIHDSPSTRLGTPQIPLPAGKNLRPSLESQPGPEL